MQEELSALTGIAGKRELGNLTLAAENARTEWGWTWLDSIIADVRYSFRVLARRSSFPPQVPFFRNFLTIIGYYSHDSGS